MLILTMLLTPLTLLLLAALTTAAPLTIPTTPHPLLKRAPPACYDNGSPRRGPLNPQECIRAIAYMPTTQVPGGDLNVDRSTDLIAHFGGDAAPFGSPFKLPRTFYSGGCFVGVSMVSPRADASESSSWNEIAREATGVVGECVAHLTRKKGGTVNVGREGGIHVEVFAHGLFYPLAGSSVNTAAQEAAAVMRAAGLRRGVEGVGG